MPDQKLDDYFIHLTGHVISKNINVIAWLETTINGIFNMTYL